MLTCASVGRKLAIVACPGGEDFANKVAVHLESLFENRHNLTENLQPFVKPKFEVKTRFTYFVNGEFKTEILESIRGKDVFVFQDIENHELLTLNEGRNTVTMSVNDHIMELLTTIDSVRQAEAAKISLVLPTYPYSRQHKRNGREGLTASLLGHILEGMSVDRIITLDIHSQEIANAFSKTHFVNLHASYQISRVLCKILDANEMENLVVVAPDTGAIDRNKFYALGLKKPLAMIYKERDYTRVSQNAKESNIVGMKLLGDVHGKVAFLADDMLGTGGTLLAAMSFLKDQGATKTIAGISLPFFNGDAVRHFEEAYAKGLFYRVIGTNAVYHKDLRQKEWFVGADVTELFANVVMRLHNNQAVSDLLDNCLLIEKLMKPTKVEVKTDL